MSIKKRLEKLKGKKVSLFGHSNEAVAIGTVVELDDEEVGLTDCEGQFGNKAYVYLNQIVAICV